jgi:hypothetical protein
VGISSGANMLQPAGALGHQKRAVQQQCHRPRHLERASGSDRGNSALGEHEPRLFVRPLGPGLGGRTSERQSQQQRGRSDLQRGKNGKCYQLSFPRMTGFNRRVFCLRTMAGRRVENAISTISIEGRNRARRALSLACHVRRSSPSQKRDNPRAIIASGLPDDSLCVVETRH